MRRQASNFLDFQERAKEFSVGDSVVPYGMFDSQAGRVTAVWPAIGMVDVEISGGNRRFPVEELQRFGKDFHPDPTHSNSGMAGMVSVSPGPLTDRVAAAFQKKSLYWASQDRKYRMTKAELECGKPSCPRCQDAPPLKKAIYKRESGISERLHGCPECMFLIKDCDIIGMEA